MQQNLETLNLRPAKLERGRPPKQGRVERGFEKGSIEALPRRVFIDSCAVQTMLKYGEFLNDGGSIGETDSIHKIPDGLENVCALRSICQVTSRAMFPWIVSDGSWIEARAKCDPCHLSWLAEIDHYGRSFPIDEKRVQFFEGLAARTDEPSFGYLGRGDRQLLKEALMLQCDSFLTTERKLPRNAPHLERELGIRVLTPMTYWDLLKPWAALWF